MNGTLSLSPAVVTGAPIGRPNCVMIICSTSPTVYRALDIATGIVVLEAIERVNRELHTCTAVITHNAAIAAMADRVIRLADGEIVEVRHNATKKAAKDLVW